MKIKRIWVLAGLASGIMILTAGMELLASADTLSSIGNIIMRETGTDGRTKKVIEIYSEDISYLSTEIETLKGQL